MSSYPDFARVAVRGLVSRRFERSRCGLGAHEKSVDTRPMRGNLCGHRMERSRTASAQTLAVGSLLAGAVFLTFFGATTSTTGCSSAEVTPTPDAAKPECKQGPFNFFCEPPAPGQDRCNTGAGATGYLSRLPPNTDYPVGCVVNFVGARDEQGDCNLEAVCKCVIGEIPTPVKPLPEAGPPADQDAGDAGDGADAGDASDDDAGTQPEPEPQPKPDGVKTGPVWICGDGQTTQTQ